MNAKSTKKTPNDNSIEFVMVLLLLALNKPNIIYVAIVNSENIVGT